MPALAVVGSDHRIVRSTESFRRRYERARGLCEKSPELDRVLAGRADVARVNVDGLSVEIEAVTDESGRRQAMLTLPPDQPAAAPDPPVAVLRDVAEDSPAIVWFKDLEGRYLYANPRYIRDLGTSEERLRDKTDADLQEGETVDGPRLRYAQDGLEEPLQLEYTVPAMDHRPAMAAFRFPLYDDSGQPIATCGVAAPTSEAQVARDEAFRLMELERWNRLDPVEVRAELLEQWHVRAAPEPGATVGVEADSDEGVEAAGPSSAETAELLENLQLTREWLDQSEQLRSELRDAYARAHKAEGEAEKARAEAKAARAELDAMRDELGAARAETEAAKAEAEAVRDEFDRRLTHLRPHLADLEAALEAVPAAA
jgi:PAS domain S-box-containing protein